MLRVAGVVLIAIGSAGALVNRSAAQTEDTTAFTVTADAQVASIRVTLPDAGLVIGDEVADVSPARANTSLDSIGTSSAYAAVGYPGDTIVSLPGTVIGVLSGFEGIRDLIPLLPPVPSYPLLATSDNLNPSVTNQAGAYTLTASTAGGESVADALVGAEEAGVAAGSLRANSHTSYDAETRTAVAEAVAEINVVRIGNLIDISQRTTGSISVAPGGTPTMTTNTLFGVSLLGSTLKVGFGPGGFQLLTGNVLDRVVLDSLLAALSNDRITIEYVPEQRAEDGSSVTSAGMRITMRSTTGEFGDVVNAVTLGQVTLSASASALPTESFGSGGTVGPTGPVTGGSRRTSTPATSGATARPAGTGTTQAAPAPVAPSPQAATPAAQAVTGPPLTLSSSSFYLVLVGAGLAALASSRLLGLLAIRLRLASAASNLAPRGGIAPDPATSRVY